MKQLHLKMIDLWGTIYLAVFMAAVIVINHIW